jgi:hypothetical protein
MAIIAENSQNIKSRIGNRSISLKAMLHVVRIRRCDSVSAQTEGSQSMLKRARASY